VLKCVEDFSVVGQYGNADADALEIVFDQIARPSLKLGEDCRELVLAFDDEHCVPAIEPIRPIGSARLEHQRQTVARSKIARIVVRAQARARHDRDSQLRGEFTRELLVEQ